MASSTRSMDTHSGSGNRITAAAAERNKVPILHVLQSHLPPPSSSSNHKPSSLLLEIASGTGQHAAYFSKHLPHITWQPTEITNELFDSIHAWSLPDDDNDNDEDHTTKILSPLLLDSSTPANTWPIQPSSCIAVLCINMIHISPFSSTQGLFEGSARVLKPNGKLIVYGPFKVNGKATTESNQAFDVTLRTRDDRWGLRDVQSELDVCAEKVGLRRVEMIEMPANNFTLIYEKTSV